MLTCGKHVAHSLYNVSHICPCHQLLSLFLILTCKRANICVCIVAAANVYYLSIDHSECAQREQHNRHDGINSPQRCKTRKQMSYFSQSSLNLYYIITAQVCLGLQGHSKMCCFITQHNVTDVSRFKEAPYFAIWSTPNRIQSSVWQTPDPGSWTFFERVTTWGTAARRWSETLTLL